MKNKKGFTLIELLAVIVILAIIALIAVPIILNMINSARKSAARSAALGYIDAIEYNNGFAQIGTDGYTLVTSGEVADLNIKLKGKKPNNGSVTIDSNGKVISATLCVNNYTVTYDGKDATVGGKCSSSSNNQQTTYTTYNPGDLLYFDPVSTNTCDHSHFNLNDVKSGLSTCYKWRVITVGDDNTKDNITVQMDHNLLNFSTWITQEDYDDDTNWNNNIRNNKGPITALKTLETATSEWKRVNGLNYTYDTSLGGTNDGINYGTLSCTSGACKIGSGENFTSDLKARMITGEEVRALTMNAGAASGTTAANWTLKSSNNDYYYFSRSDKELGTKISGTGSTDLAWLSENTQGYQYSGSTTNIYDEMTFGYWTLSPVYDNSYYAWIVDDFGYFTCNNAIISTIYGTRPVITMPKSVFSS